MAATTPTEASNDKIVVPDSAVDNSSPPQTDSDPTLANAGMTELEDPPLNAMSSINAVVTNGHSADSVITDSPEQGRSGGGAANEAGEAGWGGASAHQQDLSGSYEIIQPRDAQETNNGVTATPAAPTNGNQPWADDPTNMAVPTQSSTSNQKPTNYPRAAAPNTEPPAASSDGFHEVVHRNGRDRGGDSGFRGGYRGSRGRGGGAFRADGGFRGSHSEYRGRGAFRGDYRGDYRGGGGEYRGGGGDYRGGGGERVFRGARDGGRGRGRGEHVGFEG